MIAQLETPVLSLVLTVAALVAAFGALKTARTPPGAVAWVVFLLTLPLVAIPLYIVFGFVNHWSYTARRRASDRALHLDRDGTVPRPRELEGRLSVFEAMSGLRAERGCGMDLLIDGEETFDAIFGAMEGARHYILVQFYTIRDDEVGARLREVACERARAGVRVHILHDAFRGVGLPRAFVRELRGAGVRIHAPRGPRRWLGALQVNYRSHRKAVVVDGQTGFTGGLNIGREYLGRSRIGPWRDTFVELTGPIVAQLQETFARDWLWATGQDISEGLCWSPARDRRDMTGLMLSAGPTDDQETGTLHFCALAGAAQWRLWIASPYFVPDIDVMTALKLAAVRGIDVKVLIPHGPDHIPPWLAAFAYFDEFRAAGGEIWRYDEAFMHSKAVLVDDDLVSIGTMNLDIRSCMLNYEQTAIFLDRGAARDVETMLKADFARAHRMDRWLEEQPLHIRLGAPFARLFAPML